MRGGGKILIFTANESLKKIKGKKSTKPFPGHPDPDLRKGMLKKKEQCLAKPHFYHR